MFLENCCFALIVLISYAANIFQTYTHQGIYQGSVLGKHNILILTYVNQAWNGKLFVSEKDFILLEGKTLSSETNTLEFRDKTGTLQFKIFFQSETARVAGSYQGLPVTGELVRKSTNPNASIKSWLRALICDPDLVGEWKLVRETDQVGKDKYLTADDKKFRYRFYANGLLYLDFPEKKRIQDISSKYGVKYTDTPYSWEARNGKLVKSANPPGRPAYKSENFYTFKGDTLLLISPAGSKSYFLRVTPPKQ